jgi:hypothetical protein
MRSLLLLLRIHCRAWQWQLSAGLKSNGEDLQLSFDPELRQTTPLEPRRKRGNRFEIALLVIIQRVACAPASSRIFLQKAALHQIVDAVSCEHFVIFAHFGDVSFPSNPSKQVFSRRAPF